MIMERAFDLSLKCKPGHSTELLTQCLANSPCSVLKGESKHQFSACPLSLGMIWNEMEGAVSRHL